MARKLYSSADSRKRIPGLTTFSDTPAAPAVVLSTISFYGRITVCRILGLSCRLASFVNPSVDESETDNPNTRSSVHARTSHFALSLHPLPFSGLLDSFAITYTVNTTRGWNVYCRA